MSQNEEKVIQLKVDEEEVQKDQEEQEAEEEEEENEQNEEAEKNDQKVEEQIEEEGGKQIILQKDDSEDNEDENGGQIIKENKKSNKEFILPNEIKINVDWEITENNDVEITFRTGSNKKLILHWGVSMNDKEYKWNHIDKECYPHNTNEFDAFALQTEFSYQDQDDLEQTIEIRFPKKNINAINFVFKEKDTDNWYNNNKNDYQISF